jgi:hypothetical protein
MNIDGTCHSPAGIYTGENLGNFMRRILFIFGITGIAMLFIFNSADWYAENAALPRYCENPQKTVDIVEEILTSETPGAGKKRRPYIVAAKLIFLVPQEENEPVVDYMVRLRHEISKVCGTRF